jgi:2-C-methyl-D-erythritol 4-phosphate cytidylyltransferase
MPCHSTFDSDTTDISSKYFEKAFETEELSTFTDDASVVEAAGFPIHLIDGSYENIKITTPEDLLFANMLLEKYRD